MRRELGMLIALVVLCGILWWSNDDFAGQSNLYNTVRQVAMLGILAIGSAFVIVTGGIDLSVGAVVGLTGVIIAFYASPTSSRVHPEAQPAIVSFDASAALPAPVIVEHKGYYGLYPENETGPADVPVYLYAGDRFGFADVEGTKNGVFLTARPIHPKVAGTVNKIVAQDQQVLKKGDEILEMSNTELDAQIDAEQKKITAIAPQAAKADEDADRLAAVYAKAAAGSREQENASRELIASRKVQARIQKAKRKAESTLDTLQQAHDALVIRAPAPGKLLAPQIKSLVGAYVKPGQDIAMFDEQHVIALSAPKYAWKSLGQLTFEAAIALAVGIALVIGLIQGLLITRLDLQPFIVTLGGMIMLRGISETITESGNISFGSESPFLKLANLGFFARNDFTLEGAYWLPYLFVICVVVFLAFGYLLHFTVFGRYLFAIGGNRDAAAFSGIRVKRVETISYVISAGLAAVAGVCWASYIGQMSHTVGTAYELSAIAACVLGGFSLRGGEGTIVGVLIGTAMINIINNGLDMFQLPRYTTDGEQMWKPKEQWRNIVIGVVILLAVILDQLVHIVQRRRRTKAAGKAPPATAPQAPPA